VALQLYVKFPAHTSIEVDEAHSNGPFFEAFGRKLEQERGFRVFWPLSAAVSRTRCKNFPFLHNKTPPKWQIPQNCSGYKLLAIMMLTSSATILVHVQIGAITHTHPLGSNMQLGILISRLWHKTDILGVCVKVSFVPNS
jgi:hypothetical protein